MRERTFDVGGAKSDHRTDSQMTNTRTGRPPTFFNTSPSAEAPRTQTGQVGETIARTRV